MISILMAAKTSTEYMPQAIGSVLAQSYTDWELIIGVNGIPDRPTDPGQLWRRDNDEHKIPNDVYAMAWLWTQQFYPKVTLRNMPDAPNKGEALNRMAAYARGEYVAILDVDDLWHPLKLERQLQAIEIDVGCGVCGTQADYFGASTGPIGTPSGRVHFANLRKQNHIVNSSVLMSQKLARWEAMDQPFEDYDLWLRLARDGHYLYNLPETLTFIRCHPGQWSHTGQQSALDKLRARYA